MYMLNSSEGKMLVHGDLNRNSVQRCTDSLKEVLKQTMLKQEIMFKKQVHELHRLYWTQKSVMKDLDYKEYDSYYSWMTKPHSSLPPLTNPTGNEPLLKETRFSSMGKVASTSFLPQELYQGHQVAYHRLQRKPLDLQLSADEFINLEEDPLGKEHTWNNLKQTTDAMYSLSGEGTSSPHELRLSLGTGMDNRKRGGHLRSLFDGKSQYSCDVIDLEESDDRLSEEYKKLKPSLGTVAPGFSSNSNIKSQVSLSSDLITPLSSVNKGPALKTAQSSTFKEYSECHLKQTSSKKGVFECHDGIFCKNLTTKMEQSASNRGVALDLNRIHLDDSFYSSDSMQANPSIPKSGSFCGAICSIQEGTCPTISCKNEVNNDSMEASDTIQRDKASSPVPLDLVNKHKCPDLSAGNSTYNETSGNVVSLICLETMSKPAVVRFEDLGSCNDNESGVGVNLKSKLENIQHSSDVTSIASREGSYEKSEVEDAVFSHTDQSRQTFEDGNGNNSPASCNSCICDHDSSRVKKMSSVTVCGALNQYSKTQSDSEDANALSEEQALATSDGSDLTKEWNNKKQESPKMDELMQSAAESLISISLKNSVCLDSFTNAGAKKLEHGKRERPQCSFDSFELIAVNLTESNVDDDCITSKPLELNDVGTKDFGLKLRRGRRMKDFQREILPGLASLSRQEIREDINIMEGVLRSREYRKMRAKMANNVDNWSPLVKSRRSRLNYVGRRNFSWKFN